MPIIQVEDTGAFQQAIIAATKAGKKAFCQISAAWCGPCQMIKDDMVVLAEDYDATYAFIYVDVDKCEGIQEAFEVVSMPTFLIFKEAGAPLDKYGGASVDKIREFAENNKNK